MTWCLVFFIAQYFNDARLNNIFSIFKKMALQGSKYNENLRQMQDTFKYLDCVGPVSCLSNCRCCISLLHSYLHDER